MTKLNKKIVHEPVKLQQDFRNFDIQSPWEGTNYLDKINKTDSYWKGDCFVFDNRVSIKHSLKPGNLSICAGCREPITKADTKSKNFEEGVSCPNCYNKLTSKQLQRFRMRTKNK